MATIRPLATLPADDVAGLERVAVHAKNELWNGSATEFTRITQHSFGSTRMKLTPDLFEARQRSLEAAFFHKVDAQLLANLRNQLAQVEEAHKLAHVSEIMDQEVLRDLVRAGVTAETLVAMRFVPMIKVAWSDRRISPEERAAVLRAAESENVKLDSPSYQLLRAWLERHPEDAVFIAWRDYIQALAPTMPAESLAKLRDRTAELCHRVAKAAGGVLGIGSISKAEQKAIDECVNAYNPKPG